MPNRYWVGGTANWDNTAGTKWSATSGGAGGASVPTTADDVFFDASSGAGTVTVNQLTVSAGSLNCTGFTGTINGAGSNSNISCVGNITLNSTMGFGSGSLGLIITGTSTLISATKEASRTTVNSGGVLTLGDAFAGSTSFDTITVNSGGTLTTSNFNVTVGTFVVNGTVNLGSSTITVSTWEFSGGTLNAGTSNIVVVGGASGSLTSGAATYYRLELTSTGASVTHTFNGSCSFDRLTLSAPAAAGCTQIVFNANQTISTMVCAGAAANRRIRLRSNTRNTQRTLTITTWSTITDVDFLDIALSSSRSGTRLGNCGNNTNVTFVAAKTVYWNLAGSNVSSDTGWATTSGGVPAANNFPLPQDTIVIDNSSAGTALSFSSLFFVGSITTVSRTTAFTLTLNNNLEILGNLTLSSGVTFSPGTNIYFSGASDQTLISAGKQFQNLLVWKFSTSKLILGDALVATGALENVSGSAGFFDTTSYNVTASTFSWFSGGRVDMGSALWTITGTGTVWSFASAATLNAQTANVLLSDTSTSARTFAGGGKTYNRLTIGGSTGTSTLTITGTNTFSEIASTKTVAHTIVFPNVTTTVGNFTVLGSAGNVVTLSRTGGSGTFTLTKTGGGVISSDYLSISNSAATPASTWYAGTNSTNGGGNTGWIFSNPPSLSGNFMMLFYP